MKITQHSANTMTRTAGRKVKVWVKSGPDGKVTYEMVKDQELGESCHKIIDKIVPQRGIAEETWRDDPNFVDEEKDEQAQAQF